jgi:hypothetical protein
MASSLYVACAAAITVLLLAPAEVHAQQSCNCRGQIYGNAFNGGDGAPLRWKYSPYIESPGPPALFCYFKIVSNESGSDVRDVRWVIANFFRRIIPANQPRATCPEVTGDTKPAPTNGQLYFNSTSDGYDTTVLEPKGGWGDQASSTPLSNSDTAIQRAQLFPALRSQMSLDVEDANGKTTFASVTFESIGKQDNQNVYLSYAVTNNSQTTVTVLVNLAATSQMMEKVPMLQRRLLLKPGLRSQFDVSTEGQLLIQPALVVVYDNLERVSGIDTAGFYTVTAAKKERPDQSFWQSIR